jgi:FkbM family methyltransferase
MADGRFKQQIRRLLPRAVRPHRILAGPLRGFRIVTSWHDYPAAILGRTERPLLAWFERNVRSGETWLDVGAHYGYTAIALSRFVGPRGRVFAFEPIVATAGHLARTRELNGLAQLTVVPSGLGSRETGEVKRLPVTRGMGDSTVAVSDTSSATVVMAKLDDVWGGICGAVRQIDGVKIDVQGMEAETVSGMALLLREFAPKLVIEFHLGVNRRSLLDRLSHLGYSGVGVPIEPMPNETVPRYADDRSYFFPANA